MVEASARGVRGQGGPPTDTALLVIGGIVALALAFGFFARLLRANFNTDQRPPTGDSEKLPLCPDCGATMVKRPQRYRIGRTIYRCATYPKCTGIRHQEKV
jgi:hypothetical protein